MADAGLTNEPLTDARGATIRMGDVVTYVKTGRYPEIKTARVRETRKKVKIGDLDELSRDRKRDDDFTTWVAPWNVIVVASLPQIEGRLNTGEDS